jgi:hypothetical protein
MMQGSCVVCPAGCAQCSISVLGTCTSCLLGYYFNPTSQGMRRLLFSPTAWLAPTWPAALVRPDYILSPTLTCQKKCVSPPALPVQPLIPPLASHASLATPSTLQPAPIVPLHSDCSDFRDLHYLPLRLLPIDRQLTFASCAQCTAPCSRCKPNQPAVCTSCEDWSFPQRHYLFKLSLELQRLFLGHLVLPVRLRFRGSAGLYTSNQH